MHRVLMRRVAQAGLAAVTWLAADTAVQAYVRPPDWSAQIAPLQQKLDDLLAEIPKLENEINQAKLQDLELIRNCQPPHHLRDLKPKVEAFRAKLLDLKNELTRLLGAMFRWLKQNWYVDESGTSPGEYGSVTGSVIGELTAALPENMSMGALDRISKFEDMTDGNVGPNDGAEQAEDVPATKEGIQTVIGMLRALYQGAMHRLGMFIDVEIAEVDAAWASAQERCRRRTATGLPGTPLITIGLGDLPTIGEGIPGQVFQTMLIEMTSADIPPFNPFTSSTGTGFVARTRRVLRGLFRPPGSPVGLRALAAPSPLFDTRQALPAGPGTKVSISLVATGSSSGPVFQLQAVNASGVPVRITADDALAVRPVQPGSLKPLAATTKDRSRLHTATVAGFCADFAKPPPAAGTLYRIAEPAVQEKLRPLRSVLAAGRQMAEQGLLRPDSEPRTYTDSIKQWSVWSRLEGWDEAAFARNFVERTRKNVVELKRPWTREVEDAVRAAVPNRWRDISAVLEQAKALPPGR